jgi:transposase-like protein
MAILLVCGVSEEGKREVLAIEPMLEESRESYKQLFEKLKERGLTKPSLIVSDAHKGLVAAIGRPFHSEIESRSHRRTSHNMPHLAVVA